MTTRQQPLRLRLALYPAVLLLTLIAWAYLSPSLATLYADHWPEALTMVLGAFVAGSTPLGGGAVAFPALTKLLEFSATDARMFSVLIQSVGMGCASILFISLKRKVYWPEITIGLLASLLVPNLIMVLMPINGIFSAAIFSFFEIVALMIIIVSNTHSHKRVLPGKLSTLLLFTLIGGLLTVTIGSGADLMLFIYLVLIRKENPVTAIPSTVIFMAINAAGSAMTIYFSGQLHSGIYSSWLAAIPVVAVAAPLGGWVIGKAHPEYVLRFIIALILFDLTSSLLIDQTHLAIKFLIIIGIASSMFILWRKYNHTL